jgi:hypothetical protein
MAAGLMGPTGIRGSALLTGVTGADGVVGFTGPVGRSGHAGLASLLTGSTGVVGPIGFNVVGPTGPRGWNVMIPAEHTAYFENRLGLVVTAPAAYVGCKFFYTAQHSGQLFTMFTGTWAPTTGDKVWIGSGSGSAPAPNPGDQGLGLPGNVSSWTGVEIAFSPGNVIPFVVISGPFLGQDQGFEVGEERWFDLQTSGGVGTIKNISLAVLEF